MMTVSNSSVVTIGESYLEYSDESISRDFHLYKHQSEAVNADSSVVVLDAPTGAGKTLAALKRVVDHNSPAIFIYPTNALVRNQVTSIVELLERLLAKRVNLIGSDTDLSAAITNMDVTDIDLFCLTGESLEELAENALTSKGKLLDALLTGTHRAGRMRILLTNPDTLYLAFTGRYQRAGRISAQIETFKTMVLDEFHLYSGPILAKIVFMVNMSRGSDNRPSTDLIFLSATHGDILDLLKNTYSDIKIIRTTPLAEKPKTGRIGRHRTLCEVRPLAGVLSTDDEALGVANDILKFYDTASKSREIKVLGIFSSVSFAIRVAKILREQIRNRGLDPDHVVYQLHGLVPSKARSGLDDMSNSILVGTSAIEVGIDFDVPYMVIEAHDIGSFLQRFGRGGRHQECEAVLYVPRVLADRLNSKKEWSFPEFVDEVHEALTELPSYAGFLCSDKVQEILCAMALAACRIPWSPYQKYERFDYDSAAEFYYVLLQANERVSVGERPLGEALGNREPGFVRNCLKNRTVKAMVKHGFLRGTMNTVLVRYPGQLFGYIHDIFTECDLFDLFKMSGTIHEAGGYWASIPTALKKRHTKESPLFIVDDLGVPSYPAVALSTDALVRYRTGLFIEPSCHLIYKDRYITNIGEKLLGGRNLAFHWRSLTRHVDFRIPRLYVDSEPGGLVLGEWSYVAEYLLEKQKEDNSIE